MRRLPKPPAPWKWLKNRTLPLLIALILVVALHPLFIESGQVTASAFPVIVLLVPMLGVAALGNWWRALPLIVMLLTCLLWGWFGYHFELAAMAASPMAFLLVAYYAYAIVSLCRQLVHKTCLQDDRIYGGLAIYLLIAFMFTTVHRHISLNNPEAYNETVNGLPVHFTWTNALYFSFSSITTLGFGDIVPKSPWARAATIVEVVCGVFVTVIFVAQLVSTQLRHSQHETAAPHDTAKG